MLSTRPARIHFRNSLFIRTIRGMTLIFLLLTVLLPVFVQGDSTISLNPNLAAVLRLDGDGRFASAYYDSEGSEVVSIEARAAEPPLDLVLELLDADGHTLAYVDAPDTDGAVISGIHMDYASRYTVRVNTFNGEGVGDVSVTVTPEPDYVLTPDTPALRVPVGANQRVLVYLEGFDLTQTLEITVSDSTGQLDPRLDVVNTRVVLMSNDDHGTADPSLNRFDARLTAQIPPGAILMITDFLGRAGWLNIAISP